MRIRRAPQQTDDLIIVQVASQRYDCPTRADVRIAGQAFVGLVLRSPQSAGYPNWFRQGATGVRYVLVPIVTCPLNQRDARGRGLRPVA